MSIPASHIDDAQTLAADAYVELFQIDFYTGSTSCFKTDHSETWNGRLWEGIALKLSGTGVYGDGQVARPKLQVQNPDGALSPFVSEGAFDGAFVTRYRVLRPDMEQNLPIFVSQVWQVSRIISLTKVSLEVELRSFGDCPQFIIPTDTFSPPLYPVVSVR